jgi:ribokinase
VILNPAPAAKLTDHLYSCLYLITPNETETEFLTGIKPNDEANVAKASEFLRKKGVKNVIITLGASGAFVYSADIRKIIPSPMVNAVDTTAAGDTFSGALAVALSEGKDIESAVFFANRAAALAVTKMGAQSSIPLLNDLKENADK